MPVQQTCFGRPVAWQMPPRRFQLFFIFMVLVIAMFFTISPRDSVNLPTYEEVKDAVKNPHLPDISDIPKLPKFPDLPSAEKLNPFGPATHKPPVQANSTASSAYRAIKWFNDFKWRNPFSNTITLDENRAVLPPLTDRPPIYTFYAPKSNQDKDISEAENRLILAWRKAWWAHGFKPQVLSRAEAMKHPQYELVQRMKLDPKVELEMMRWMAWGFMGGGGVLTNWLALPMAPYDDPFLEFLRRKEYPELSKLASMSNCIFFGDGRVVDKAIKKAVNNELLKDVAKNKEKIAELAKKDGGAMVNLIGTAEFTTHNKIKSIACYSFDTIDSQYKIIADKLTNTTRAEGLGLLADLINSHLHLTFQNTFSDGIAIVKPLPEHTTALMHEAIDIGRNLTQCPSTPMPKSCPPNQPKCTPCVSNKAPKLQLVPFYKKNPTLFSIGTVPHPYTLNLLHYTRDTLDSNFLRNNAQRNMWLYSLTKDLLGDTHMEQTRAVTFKEIVADPSSASHSLWLTAERISQADIDWILGFNLPQSSSDAPPSSPPAPKELQLFPRPPMPLPLEGVEVPGEKWIKNEEERINKAREVLQSKDRRMQEVVKMVEEWNLADVEAWTFARAFSARRRTEREVWEEEEKKFAGTEKKAGVRLGAGGGRWSD